MSPRHESANGYEIVECSRDEIPARFIDMSSWPKRDCIQLPITYNEWFDWSELFASGAEKKLLNISNELSSQEIFISGILTDLADEFLKRVSVIKILSRNLEHAYFKAIWDERSMPQRGPLAAAARIVLFWDASERWIIFNDRYYEIGLFAVLNCVDHKLRRNIFRCLDQQSLLDRFSKILTFTKVATLAELERWF